MFSASLQIRFAVFCFLMIGLCSETWAQKLPFLRRKPNKQAVFQELEVEDGPWLVMCASFTGENAEEQARLLSRELQGHRLKTYIYRQTFDYSESVVGIGWQKPQAVEQLAVDGELRQQNPGLDPEPKRMKSANLSKTDEVAVLVGDFSDVDDARAQKTLAKIKKLSVESMASPTGDRKHGNLERSAGGPLRTAILVPNPKLPDEYFRKNNVDEYILKINRPLKYSLLKCPSIYTVKIASFRGEATIDPNKIAKGKSQFESLKRTGQKDTGSGLTKAENNAHDLTTLLRKKGVEAYEFHDRHESYVCIGSFDYVTKRSGDVVMNNPAIVAVVNSCTPEVQSRPGAPNGIIPKSIGGLPLDPQPAPILAPKERRNRTGGIQSLLPRRF